MGRKHTHTSVYEPSGTFQLKAPCPSQILEILQLRILNETRYSCLHFHDLVLSFSDLLNSGRGQERDTDINTMATETLLDRVRVLQ